MSETNAMRKRLRAQRLEIPDKSLSVSALDSVEVACRKFLEKRGISSNSFWRVKKKSSMSDAG